MKLMFYLFISVSISLICSGQAKVDSTCIPYLKSAKPYLHGRSYALKLSLDLESIYVQNELFWFCFNIKNRSALSYPVDMMRIYLHDRLQTARSSSQELDIIPVYTDSLTLVKPHAQKRFVIAIAKFTIPDSKYCMIEIFEQNGARNLLMPITNWQLFKARPVPTKQITVAEIIE